MQQHMTSAVIGLLSLAAALQSLSVGAQIVMHRKNVGFLFRSPFGTALNMIKQWALRRGSCDPVRNKLRKQRWLSMEASRTAVCDYFDYRSALKPSVWDILTGIAYAATLPASWIRTGVVQWLTLVAIVVVLYYFFAFIGTLSSLGSRQMALRLSYAIGISVRRSSHCLPQVADLISTEVIPKELRELALTSKGIGWWAKCYWRAETHEERNSIGKIIKGILKLSRVELELRMQKSNCTRTTLLKHRGALESANGQSLYLSTQEDFLSCLPSELAWQMRVDPAFESMVANCVRCTEGSKEQRKAVKSMANYIYKQMVANRLHARYRGITNRCS
jgi:hypothetical protein